MAFYEDEPAMDSHLEMAYEDRFAIEGDDWETVDDDPEDWEDEEEW